MTDLRTTPFPGFISVLERSGKKKGNPYYTLKATQLNCPSEHVFTGNLHTALLLSAAPLPSPVTTRPHHLFSIIFLTSTSSLYSFGFYPPPAMICLLLIPCTEHPPSLPKSGTEQFLHSRAGLSKSEGAKRTITSHQWAPLTSRCSALEPHKIPQQKTSSGACSANT